MGDPKFYIVDLRPEWAGRPCISFWRPDNCGYAYPLAWSGRYDEATIVEGGAYYTKQDGSRWVRFAAPCEVVERLAVPTPPRIVDGNVGPVVMNTGKNRSALRRARFTPAQTEPRS
jgi:hypothetical protein